MCQSHSCMCHIMREYQNALHTGITEKALHHLRLMQNNATQVLIMGTWHHNHVQTVLYNLHWLPLKKRIIFQIQICLGTKLYTVQMLQNTSYKDTTLNFRLVDSVCTHDSSSSGHKIDLCVWC